MMAVEVGSDPLLVGGTSVAGAAVCRDLDRRLPGPANLVDAFERAGQVDGIVEMKRLGLSDTPVAESGVFNYVGESEHQRGEAALSLDRNRRVGGGRPAQ